MICTPKSGHESVCFLYLESRWSKILSLTTKHMSKRIFNEEEIELLLQNPNVEKCSERSIAYKESFKISAVKKYHEGLPAAEIFGQAGINTAVIGRKSAKWCLSRWLKTFKKKGLAGLGTDGRKGNNPKGRPKTNWSNEKEKIKYLETENAYLKAENDFLAKLRKKSLN